MPEGLYFLSHACIYLALAPKSNSTNAIFKAQREVKQNGAGTVPSHLRDQTANTKKARYHAEKNASDDYKYPHSFTYHWVKQQYLPDDVDLQAYEAGSAGREKKLWKRIEEIRERHSNDG